MKTSKYHWIFTIVLVESANKWRFFLFFSGISIRHFIQINIKGQDYMYKEMWSCILRKKKCFIKIFQNIICKFSRFQDKSGPRNSPNRSTPKFNYFMELLFQGGKRRPPKQLSHLFWLISRYFKICINLTPKLLSTKLYWYLSYFSTKTYAVVLIRSPLVRHF